MAIFHLNESKIVRGKNHSAIASSCYRTGTRREHERSESVIDYTSRVNDVLHSEILIPPGAPSRFMDGEILWNEAELAEGKRKKVCLARERDGALPHELGDDDHIDISRDYAAYLMDKYQVGVEFAIHLPDTSKGQDKRNVHVHFMFTSREIGPDGFGKKTRVLDDFKTGPIELKKDRKVWEQINNAYLEKAGLDERIDCRTLEEQGIDRIPQVHEGPTCRNMQRDGKKPESKVRKAFRNRKINYPKIDQGTRSEYNASIIELNKKKERLGPAPIDQQLTELEGKIDGLIETISDIEAILPIAFLSDALRAKIQVAFQRLQKIIFLRIFEKIARKKRKKELETLRLQKRVERLRLKLEEFERKRRQLWDVKGLYMKMNVFCLEAPFDVIRVNYPKPLVTRIEFKEKITVNAKAMRMNVIPEYRPKIKERHSKHEDNGGKAAPPPSIREPFNKAVHAIDPPEKKVVVTFGPHAQRSNSP